MNFSFRTPTRRSRRWLAALPAGPVPGFVTAGVGTSILPLRFNCRPEYLIVRLRPASDVPASTKPASV